MPSLVEIGPVVLKKKNENMKSLQQRQQPKIGHMDFEKLLDARPQEFIRLKYLKNLGKSEASSVEQVPSSTSVENDVNAIVGSCGRDLAGTRYAELTSGIPIFFWQLLYQNFKFLAGKY